MSDEMFDFFNALLKFVDVSVDDPNKPYPNKPVSQIQSFD